MFIARTSLRCMQADALHVVLFIGSHYILITMLISSNPYVQNAAVHGGALTHLSRLLTLETSGAVLSRALYALSSVIR